MREVEKVFLYKIFTKLSKSLTTEWLKSMRRILEKVVIQKELDIISFDVWYELRIT